MTSQTRVAFLILATLTLSAAQSMHAQQRWNTNTTSRPTYTPPAREYQPQVRQTYTPPPVRETQQYQPVTRQTYTPPTPAPQNREYTSSSVNVISTERRTAIAGVRRHGGHIDSNYFASEYGRAHTFSFGNLGASFTTNLNGELYFHLNGGDFGVVTPIPSAWRLAFDSLYIDIGDDGNYYLYDSQFPDVAV